MQLLDLHWRRQCAELNITQMMSLMTMLLGNTLTLAWLEAASQ